MTLEDLALMVEDLEDAKGWREKTDVPGLFMYLSEEVGELAKATRRMLVAGVDAKDAATLGEENLKRMAEDELGDVLLNVLMISNRLGLSPTTGFYRKLKEVSSRDWIWPTKA